jgi:hypothetical protein
MLAQEIILQFLQGATEPKTRQDVIDHVAVMHLGNGGVQGKVTFTAVVKKALSNLQMKGLVSNARRTGFWETTSSTMETVISVSPQSEPVSRVSTIQPEARLSSSGGAVYLYFFENYRALALSRGDRLWPCKVGYTQGEVEHRVRQQIGTGHPERPIIALQEQVPNADFERAVHGILRAWGRQVLNAGGEEWFTTSPDEVEQLLQKLLRLATRPDL